jgi:murein L,D-transpeptidase YafK
MESALTTPTTRGAVFLGASFLLALAGLLCASTLLGRERSLSRVGEGATGVLPRVDRVLVLKSERTLQLCSGGSIVRSYKVALGFTPVGAKARKGDGRTPEGRYSLDWRNPGSRFHRSLHISYPNPDDRARARRHGVSPGGDIFVHGLPNGFGHIGANHRLVDWTLGCIAVTNEEIEEIWRLVTDGTPIEIKP